MDYDNVLDYLSSNRTVLSLNVFKDLDINITNFYIPSVTMNPNRAASPMGSSVFYNSKLEWSPLDVSFIVTKDLSNWLSIFNYLYKIAPPDKQGRADTLENFDATAICYSPQNNPVLKVTFVNAIITELGQVQGGSDSQEADVVKANIVLSYDYYKIEKL